MFQDLSYTLYPDDKQRWENYHKRIEGITDIEKVVEIYYEELLLPIADDTVQYCAHMRSAVAQAAGWINDQPITAYRLPVLYDDTIAERDMDNGAFCSDIQLRGYLREF